MFVSVLIPTRNRCEPLRAAITSLQELDYPKKEYEIIVIDNSTDGTPRMVEECNERGAKEVLYVRDMRDGLLTARHTGARVAKGDVLAYIDDDVLCDPAWLSELTRPYADPTVGCVGGRVTPRYETREPEWAALFPSFLSILDRGSEVTTVNDDMLWGCNFSVRKSVLYDVGGFNPDTMPWALRRYGGDGETGLLHKVVEKGYDVVYTPFARVTHVIPHERTTVEYLQKRAFIRGIEHSYAEIRKHGGMVPPEHARSALFSAISTFSAFMSYVSDVNRPRFQYLYYNPIARFFWYKEAARATQCLYYKELAHECLKRGVSYHREEVSKDPTLLEFVLQERYLCEGPS